jgi:hypothetical protein
LKCRFGTNDTPYHGQPYGQPYGYIYPFIVLQDGRIVVWLFVERILRAYNPRTSIWTDMATLKDYFDVALAYTMEAFCVQVSSKQYYFS